jgi:hypothetical protein
MKISKSLATLALFIFILVPLVCFLLGMKYGESKQLSASQAAVNQLEREKSKLTEELDLFIKDEAKLTNESTYIFASSSKLGINSPRFLNREVKNREYYYKGSVITEHELEVPTATEELYFKVTIWQYRDTDLIKRAQVNPPRVTFYFFNNNTPIKPVPIAYEETEKNQYKNKNQIRMVRTMNEANQAVYYEFFLSNQPMYVTVHPIKPYGMLEDLTKEDSAELKDFVDSISISE